MSEHFKELSLIAPSNMPHQWYANLEASVHTSVNAARMSACATKIRRTPK